MLKWNSSKEIYNFCNFWPAQNYNSNFRSAEIVVTGNLKGRILWNRFFFSTWKSMCWLIEKNENWKMIPFYFPRFASLPLLLPQLSWKTLPVMWDDPLHVGKTFFFNFEFVIMINLPHLVSPSNITVGLLSKKGICCLQTKTTKLFIKLKIWDVLTPRGLRVK